jgi:hypothetical protein
VGGATAADFTARVLRRGVVVNESVELVYVASGWQVAAGGVVQIEECVHGEFLVVSLYLLLYLRSIVFKTRS